MTKHEIATVEARRPAPFTATPTLVMVLAAQAGTGAHYVQVRGADEDLDMLDAEARALETVGAIDGDALAADWTLVSGETEMDAAMADENLVDALAIAEGPELQIDEPEEEVEALV